MIKSLLATAAALALMAGTALAAPVAPHSSTAATPTPAAADWGVTKEKVGYKRRKARGHRFSHRRFPAHRFSRSRAFGPRYFGGFRHGYSSGYHRGFRGFSVRGPGTVR